MNDRSLEEYLWGEQQKAWVDEANRQAEERYQQIRATLNEANQNFRRAGETAGKVYAGKPGARITGSIIDETHNWKQIGWISEDGFDLGNSYSEPFQYARHTVPATGGGTITLVLDPSMDTGGFRIIQGKPIDKHPPAHPPYRGMKEALAQHTCRPA